MLCVIQCAGSKQANAATLPTMSGRRVMFVARPDAAPPEKGVLYAHPDDMSDITGITWRQRVMAVNAGREPDPGLWIAGKLYRPKAYALLLEKLGIERLFILSAGWGLVRADFLLPDYDITFSTSAEPWKRRRASDKFSDFNALERTQEDIVFLGGKDYLPLFLRLTRSAAGRRLVVYNSANPPVACGCALTRYPTTRRTNWHYDCAEALAAGTWHPDFEAVPS